MVESSVLPSPSGFKGSPMSNPISPNLASTFPATSKEAQLARKKYPLIECRYRLSGILFVIALATDSYYCDFMHYIYLLSH